MTDFLTTSHSSLMDQRAKGKRLHRRTQSSTKHDLASLFNKKVASEEFIQEMFQSQNILNTDSTQRALDADIRKNEDKETEVIIDDINEIPKMGFVVPKSNFSHNPLNFISRKALIGKAESIGSLSVSKKTNLLDNIKNNIDEFTGLNTIHEKKNSMDSVPDLVGASPDLLSMCNPQESKGTSRNHSKQSSMDFRPGHSKTSSADFRNHLNLAVSELKSYNQMNKAEKENIQIIKFGAFPSTESNENQINLHSLIGNSMAFKGHNSRSQNMSAHSFATNKLNEYISSTPKGISINLNDTLTPKSTLISKIKSSSEKTSTKSLNTKLSLQKDQRSHFNQSEFDSLYSSSNRLHNNITSMSASMKHLSEKTEMLENQLKAIFQVVESFAQDKTYLEEVYKAF